jgi:hypothetical protein
MSDLGVIPKNNVKKMKARGREVPEEMGGSN